MVYGLIVPPGIPVAVAEALEGDHHNPDIDEMQSRMALREYLGPDCTTGDALRVVFLSENRMRDCYLPSDSKWGIWGERYGRQ